MGQSILLRRLSIYGIRNAKLNWFKSNRENRMQLPTLSGRACLQENSTLDISSVKASVFLAKFLNNLLFHKNFYLSS